MGCNFFPFDSDVISLEVPELFREYNLENDSTCLYQVAQSILFLQSIYGPISHVWGKGAAAKQVWDFVLRLQRENENEDTVQQNHNSCIDQIILIDRSIDLISPLATQLTYEGLIDEIYGINSNTVKIPSEKFLSLEERQTESLREVERKIILDSSDQLFADLRDKNFSGVRIEIILLFSFRVIVTFIGSDVAIETSEADRCPNGEQTRENGAGNEVIRPTVTTADSNKEGFGTTHGDSRDHQRSY